MGSLGNEDRIQAYKDRFEGQVDDEEMPKFHYGSHYSSPAIVTHFLLRLSPFTEGGKLLQNGSFDLPDRMFFSIADSFKYATEDIADVRELTPEFYFMPEVFLNLNCLNLGVMQNGTRVNNTELPFWAD